MPAILPTANTHWGFWGTSVRNGYDPDMAWQAASDALATAFDLAPAEIRDLLDARFGRHLADDLSFVPGGPRNAGAIEDHIISRLAKHSWRKWFEEAIRDLRVPSTAA